MATPFRNQLQLLSYGALFAAVQSALGDEKEFERRVEDAQFQLAENNRHPWYQQQLMFVVDELRELLKRRALTNEIVEELIHRATMGVA